MQKAKTLVVFLPGAGRAGGSHPFFRELRPRLEKQFDLLSPEVSDGRALKPIVEKADAVVAAVSRKIKQSRPGKVVFVGHSQGGLVGRIAIERLRQEAGGVSFGLVGLFCPKDAGEHDAGLRRFLHLTGEPQRAALGVSAGVRVQSNPDVSILHAKDPILGTQDYWDGLGDDKSRLAEARKTHFLSDAEVRKAACEQVCQAIELLHSGAAIAFPVRVIP